MNYANRCKEYAKIQDYLDNKENVILIKAYPASGITTFVRNKLNNLFLSIFEEKNIFYIDLKNNGNLGDNLFSLLVKSKHIKEFQKVANNKLGTRSEGLFSSLLGCIPYMGSFIKQIVKPKIAEQVYAGNYSSAMEEFLNLFFTENISNRYLIILDAIECIFEISYDLLTKLLQCQNLCIILIETEYKTYQKLENHLYDHGIDIKAEVSFNPPEVKLIEEIGALYNIELTPEEAEDILEKNEQNIHQIISQIRNYSKDVKYNQFTKVQEAIILILSIWSEPLDEKLIFEIIDFSKIFFAKDFNYFKDTLCKMEHEGILIHSKSSWQLSGWNSLYLQEVINDITNQLLYKNVIYNFLRENESINISLRYRLSKEILQSDSLAARLYLRQLLVMGKIVPEDVFLNAKLKKDNKTDCLFAGIKYCRERKYLKAFEWIDSITNDQDKNDIDAFRSALLNRIRKSNEAEIALINCLKKRENNAQQNLLGAFLISNYIHMEDLTKAKEVYNRMKDLYVDFPNHGYLVRNATSAFKEYRDDLYTQALNDFSKDKDDFGYYTTLCNQGYALCKNGNYTEGFPLLKKSEIGLKMFPKINLHIINNDLGLCYFLMGEYEDAFRYFY